MNISYSGTTEDRESFQATLSSLMEDSINRKLVKATLTAVAELLENVYEHAHSSSSNSVNWNLKFESEGSKCAITVSDNGCGIPFSIQKKSKILASDPEAIKLAIGFRSDSGRGLGLLSIKCQVESGIFDKLEISSRTGKYEYSKKSEEVLSVIEPYQGTRVQVLLDIGVLGNE